MSNDLCRVNAIIIDVQGDNAIIQTQNPSEECAGCSAMLCGVKKKHRIKLKISGAVKGQKVSLEMPSLSLALTAFWLYFAGACVGIIPACLFSSVSETAAAAAYLFSISLWILCSSILLNRYVKKRIKIHIHTER